MTNAKPPVQHASDSDVVARTARELKTMSDEDLLGHDYRGWLNEEKGSVRQTLRDGEEARARAERLMARSEELLDRAKRIP